MIMQKFSEKNIKYNFNYFRWTLLINHTVYVCVCVCIPSVSSFINDNACHGTDDGAVKSDKSSEEGTERTRFSGGT